MATFSKSRWKSAHDRFPAHVEEAKNSDGNVHRGYHLLEFRVAAELLRVGPVHSAEDYWAPSDWQLLLVVSEYMSGLLEFLDWFWPDLGWEHHKQAIVLSKRLLQPRSPYTYPDLQIDPQLRAAWQSFTYCFWHGTRHLPATAPPGDPPVLFNAAREWLTKLVGERGFEAEGHIVSALQSWIQATQPRMMEAFPSVDWSHWPTVVFPDPECAYRVVEKRGALKRRQQEEDYAVRWPLRVTQGRPKFNHLKMEARDGFVVAIPSIKNPPALGFLAVSDVMCAFKQSTQYWPPAAVSTPAYSAQQDVVQSFVQNVLRETRGPLAPGIVHEQYKYLGFLACCMLGWQHALISLATPLRETAAWGPQPLVLQGGRAAPLPDLPSGPGQFTLSLGLGRGMVSTEADAGAGVDLGIAARLAQLQPSLLPDPATVDAALAAGSMLPLALQAPPLQLRPQHQQAFQPLQQLQPLAVAVDTGARAVAGLMEVAAAAAATAAEQGMGQAGGAGGNGGAASRQDSMTSSEAPTPTDLTSVQHIHATRTRPSPFLARQTSATSSGAPRPASFSGRSDQPRAQQAQLWQPTVTAAAPTAVAAVLDEEQEPQRQHTPGPDAHEHPERAMERAAAAGAAAATEHLDGPAPMSLGGLSSMQDLIDGLPSQADISWSAILGTAGVQDDAEGAGAPGAAAATVAGAVCVAAPTVAAAGTAAPQAQQQPQSGWSVQASRPGLPMQAPMPEQLDAALPLTAALQPGFSDFLPAGLSGLQPGLTGLLTPSLTGLQPGLSGLQPGFSGLQPGLSGVQPTGAVPGLQPFDSGLPYGTLQYPQGFSGSLQPPRAAADAPVHIHPPSPTGSPCLATVTTGSLPGSGLLAGLPRAEPSGGEPRLARRSHGEVFTLSPVTSCGPNGDTTPSSPALGGADTAAVAAAVAVVEPSTPGRQSLEGGSSAAAAAVEGDGRVVNVRQGGAGPAADGHHRSRDASPLTGGRRTRHDVAMAAAAAAADTGLSPAPGSAVEPCAKRPNAAQPCPGASKALTAGVTAERVESLGAFLTDQEAGLGARAPGGWEVQEHRGTGVSGSAAAAAAGSDVAARRRALGEELLRLLRDWAEAAAEGAAKGQGIADRGSGEDAVGIHHGMTCMDVQRRAAELLAQGAPVNAMTEAATAAAAGRQCAGYSPLHWACLRGDAALAELLLRHGADPDQRDAAGVPARRLNPAFRDGLEQLVAAMQAPTMGTKGRDQNARNQRPCTSAFATSAATAAAAAAASPAPTVAAATQRELFEQLSALLHRADHLAGQLAQQDPAGAQQVVLQAVQGTGFLYPLMAQLNTSHE